MLLSKNRVDKKNIEQVFKYGKSIHTPSLTFKFLINKNTTPKRFSFIVAKNLIKLANKRNSLRRMGYRVLKKHLHLFPTNLVGIFLFKKKDVDQIIIENEIKKISSKIN